MTENSKNPLSIFSFHAISVLLVNVPAAIFKFTDVQPFQRGFYCNDESIRYPYKPETISFQIVGIVAFGFPALVILLTELFHKRSNLGKKSKDYKQVPEVLVNIHIFVGILTFGASFDQMLTNTAKYMIGRPRPHFIDACKLGFSKINCSDHQYATIDNSMCQQTDQHLLKEIRLSFPSGHSSFSAYGAVALSIYLMKRWMLPKTYIILRSLIQVLSIGLAVACGLSRVSDYRHHWSDVLAGFGSGTMVAISVWCHSLHIDVKRDLEGSKEFSNSKIISYTRNSFCNAKLDSSTLVNHEIKNTVVSFPPCRRKNRFRR